MQASINVLFVCVRTDGREITYSVAPATQQVVGQGVVWLQLDGFIQMILGDRQTETDGDRQSGRRFSQLIHDTAAVSPAFCSDLICPASPTHNYFTNTSHTRNLNQRPHTPGYHTHTHTLPRSFPFSLALIQSIFFYIVPLQHSISASFTCQELFRYTVFGGGASDRR